MNGHRARASIVIGLMLLCACHRGAPGKPLLAAFSDDSQVGRIVASWSELPASAGANATAMPHQLRFSIEVTNELGDPLFIRLRNFRLVDGRRTVAAAPDEHACVLQAKQRVTILGGVLAAAAADDFAVEAFAVPLSPRGRAFYREFALRQRPGEADAINAELAAFVAAPACAQE